MEGKSQQQMGVVDELRRRKVLRSTTIYAVVGWCLLQWCNLLIQQMGWPAWSITLVLTFIVLGFPVVVALSWAFDITPAGVKRTNPEEIPELVTTTSSRLVTLFVTILLAVTIGYLVIG
jgi:hypothetical protein